MNTKSLSRVEIKDAEKGEVRAVFATFNVKDKDGDVTLPGAFADGARVPISAYGHMSTYGTAAPVGVGVLHANTSEAWVDAKFFLDTEAGRDTFRVVKRLAEHGLGDWSYGYTPVKFSYGEHDGERVRFLEQQQVHEVSPVLTGAGVGTRTVSAKAAGADTTATPPLDTEQETPVFKGIKAHEAPTENGRWTGVVRLRDDSFDDLMAVHAAVDLANAKGYMPHHGTPGGPASVRACLVGIAALNGAAGAPTLPDAERKAAYDHLAEHLRHADYESIPELREGARTIKMNDEIAVALAGIEALVDRLEQVGAARAEKGKRLTRYSYDLLAWADEVEQRLKALLITPNEIARLIFLARIAADTRSHE